MEILPDGWTDDGVNGTVGIDIKNDFADAVLGGASLEFSPANGTAWAYGPTMAIEDGAPVFLKFYHKRTATVTALVELLIYDKDRILISTIAPSFTASTGAWVRNDIFRTIAVGPTARYMRPRIGAYSSVFLTGVVKFSGVEYGQTQPRFSAYRSASQVIPAATWTKILFDTENFDYGNQYDTIVNSAASALYDGIYQFTGGVYLSGITSGDLIISAIRKGPVGSEVDLIRGPRLYAGGTTFQAPMTTPPVELAIGDQISFWVYASAGATVAAGATISYFGGHRLS